MSLVRSLVRKFWRIWLFFLPFFLPKPGKTQAFFLWKFIGFFFNSELVKHCLIWNTQNKRLFRYTYIIYTQKLSTTFFWVSKLDVKLWVEVKNFKITICRQLIFFWSKSMIPCMEYQITYSFFNGFRIIFVLYPYNLPSGSSSAGSEMDGR